MRFVCVSDTHSKHDEITKDLPDGDAFIHCGDLTPRGNWDEFKIVGDWFESLRDKYKYRIMIAGNHDWALQLNKRMTLDASFDKDVIYLEDSGVNIDGINIYGTPWMPPFFCWAFMKDEEDLVDHYAAIPDNTDLLITHSPPYGILDFGAGHNRCGSISLLERIQQLPNLKHHVFGHIHESYGKIHINDTVFHNVSSLNGNYQYKNKPQVFDI